MSAPTPAPILDVDDVFRASVHLALRDRDRTYLQAGQKFTLYGVTWTVAYVNQSRAHCESKQKHLVTVFDRKLGHDRTFQATTTRTMDISPTTCIDMLAEVLGGAR